MSGETRWVQVAWYCAACRRAFPSSRVDPADKGSLSPRCPWCWSASWLNEMMEEQTEEPAG